MAVHIFNALMDEMLISGHPALRRLGMTEIGRTGVYFITFAGFSKSVRIF